MNQKYIYHYCAKYNNCVYDGIAEINNELLSFEDYTVLKQKIIDSFNIKATPNNLTITSLSSLGIKKIENKELLT